MANKDDGSLFDKQSNGGSELPAAATCSAQEPHSNGAPTIRDLRQFAGRIANDHDRELVQHAADLIEVLGKRAPPSAGGTITAEDDLRRAEKLTWECSGSAFMAGENSNAYDRKTIYEKLCAIGNLIASARGELSAQSSVAPMSDEDLERRLLEAERAAISWWRAAAPYATPEALKEALSTRSATQAIYAECEALARKKSVFSPAEDPDDNEYWRGYAKGREEAAEEIRMHASAAPSTKEGQRG